MKRNFIQQNDNFSFFPEIGYFDKNTYLSFSDVYLLHLRRYFYHHPSAISQQHKYTDVSFSRLNWLFYLFLFYNFMACDPDVLKYHFLSLDSNSSEAAACWWCDTKAVFETQAMCKNFANSIAKRDVWVTWWLISLQSRT